jgi:hypothetical protein
MRIRVGTHNQPIVEGSDETDGGEEVVGVAVKSIALAMELKPACSRALRKACRCSKAS